MPERICVERLVKQYPGATGKAIDDLSLEVEPGTFLVLLGPSGSGKTTLLRCVAGIDKVSAGRLRIGEVVVADERVHVPSERRDLAMVFQDYALWPHLRARDNVAFALRRHRVGRAEAARQATAMLERVGLGLLAERYPSELSGGEQQRVALARALIGGTGLILCDEPLSNLDAHLREQMRVEISSLVRSSGATAIYITHDQAEAFALADRVGVLEAGRLVQLGAPEEVYASPATPFVARFTGLAAELAVRPVSPVGSSGTLTVVPSSLPARSPIEARWRGEGAACDGLLAIRPTAVELCGLDDDGHQLAGTVADVAFRGRGYEHAIDLGGGVQVTGVFAEHRVPRGASVGLRLDVAGCHVYPAVARHADPLGETGPGPAVPAPPARRELQLAGNGSPMMEMATEVAS